MWRGMDKQQLFELYRACDYNMTTVGKQLHVSRERVRQVLTKHKVAHGRGVGYPIVHHGPTLAVRNEIVTLARSGMTNAAICKKLGISKRSLYVVWQWVRRYRINCPSGAFRRKQETIARGSVRCSVKEHLCTKCDTVKPIDQFYKRVDGGVEYLQTGCKECRATRQWKYRGCRGARRKYGTNFCS